jgi:chaperone required for assembly of F1-ATPase
MSRRLAFTQADVSRAIKGAKAAGMDIGKVTMGLDGRTIEIFPAGSLLVSDLATWQSRRTRDPR